MFNSNLCFDASLKDMRNRLKTCKERWKRNKEKKIRLEKAFEPPNSGDCPKTSGDISRYRRGSRNKSVNVGLSCDAL